MSRNKKYFLFTFCMTLFLVLSGALYQWVSENSDRELIPGELVSVNEHQFHLLCKGKGSPLILLENGLWGSYTDWLYIIDAVSEDTTMCAYDRLGMGWSSENDKATRAQDVAAYLKKLLTVENYTGPKILVGFSAGGMYVREFYNQFPENVVGMMLIDSAHEQQAFRMAYIPTDLSPEKFCNAIAWMGFGRLFNLLNSYVEKSFSVQQSQEQLRAFNRTNFCAGLILQSDGMEQDLFMNTPPRELGSLPLVVISAGKPLREQTPIDAVPNSFLDEHEEVWPKLQEELSRLSTNSTHILAENSGHAVQLEKPEIVINALRNMVYEYRARKAL